jgi:hypothetical protein
MVSRVVMVLYADQENVSMDSAIWRHVKRANIATLKLVNVRLLFAVILK